MNIARAIGSLKEHPLDMPCAMALWVPEDVQVAAEELGVTLSDGEVCLVLSRVDREQDASLGITWDTLRNEIRRYVRENRKESPREQGIANAQA
jgi:hypothetical protein